MAPIKVRPDFLVEFEKEITECKNKDVLLSAVYRKYSAKYDELNKRMWTVKQLRSVRNHRNGMYAPFPRCRVYSRCTIVKV
jgi:hypothetical protein